MISPTLAEPLAEWELLGTPLLLIPFADGIILSVYVIGILNVGCTLATLTLHVLERIRKDVLERMNTWALSPESLI